VPYASVGVESLVAHLLMHVAVDVAFGVREPMCVAV
jgi:hypothetical protein